jgi:uncharacterized membrane protein YhaH (DUF805 family)
VYSPISLLFNFTGRIGRLQFLAGYSYVIALLGAMAVVSMDAGLAWFLVVPVVIGSLALFTKRLRDLNMSLWWIAFIVITNRIGTVGGRSGDEVIYALSVVADIASIGFLIFLVCRPGKEGRLTEHPSYFEPRVGAG